MTEQWNYSSTVLAATSLLLTLASVLIGTFFISTRGRRALASINERYKLRRLSAAASTNNSNGSAHISELFVYPVKSLRAVPVDFIELDSLGLRGDRRLMIVRPCPSAYTPSQDERAASHRFITQRQCAALTSIDASIPVKLSSATTLIRLTSTLLGADSKVFINVSNNALKSYPVRYRAGIWDDVVDVVDVGDEAAQFVQSVMMTEDENFSDVRVVSMLPNITDRVVGAKYIPPSVFSLTGATPRVSLTDGFPILIATDQSLKELNNRLAKKGKEALPMSRFRPNIVISNTSGKPFDEDEWKAIQIGGQQGPILHIVKGCPRCKQSCTDQLSGERGAEPLDTLSEFRALGRRKEDVYFAQNAVVQPSIGRSSFFINVGDSVTVLTRGSPVWDLDDVQAE